MIVCIFLILDVSQAQQKGAQSKRMPAFSTSASSTSTGPQATTGTGLQLREIALEGEAGNMYVGNAWPLGRLVLRDGKIIDNYRYRYDIYADQMQFISDNDTLAFSAPAEMETVTFDGMTFLYSYYECTGMLMKGYFELLVPGRKQLLLKRSVTYHLEEDNMRPEIQKETYLITETFFFKTGNQPAQKLLCSRKAALDAMSDHKKELDDFLKKSGNKVRTPDDLKKLVIFYNSLN